MESQNFTFICDSDQHFKCTDGQSSSRKDITLANILAYKKVSPVDFLLAVGDLTESGAEGYSLGSLVCIPQHDNGEFTAFQERYQLPLEVAGIKVYMCHGNHDLLKKVSHPTRVILRKIRQLYNATFSWTNDDESGCYTFTHKGVMFISLGMGPNASNLRWLESVMPADRQKPIVFFFHHAIDPVYRDDSWIDDASRTAFHKLIRFHNVKLIVNGHIHANSESVWNGIHCIVCGNGLVVHCNNGAFTVEVGRLG